MMKKKTKVFWLTVAALVFLAGAAVPPAMAYFTTYVEAEGGYPITLGNETTIEEKVENMEKHIVLTNTGESDCFVRVKVFAGSQITLTMSGSSWNQGEDGYWYYSDIVPVSGNTEELLAKIAVPEEYKESFNVVVVQECTPVLYEEDGTPYADWNRIADTRTDIGTADAREAGEE